MKGTRAIVLAILFTLIVAIVAIVAARIAFPVPAYSGPSSAALPAAGDSRLGRAFAPLTASHPGESGIVLLSSGPEAFVARLSLVEAAEHSIDVRMYIWRRDMTGLILMRSMLDAANRGVRIRLLLDDNGVRDFDSEIAAFEQHPNMEVRIFNPFVLRWPSFLNYAFDFFRLNRRMHNKSITIDGVATILGGRNIGDEYFSAGQGVFFIDLDLVAIGPIVAEVADDFDRYWASASAIPARNIVEAGHASLEALESEAAEAAASRTFVSYRDMLADAGTVARMAEGDLQFYWARARLYSDDPAKGLGRTGGDRLMIARLENEIGVPERSINLVSPYYIPGREGVEIIRRWTRQGVRVEILTNSFLATDVVPVHSGYTKYRRRLLKAGIRLFELKRDPSTVRMRRDFGLAGSSGASLHAKTFSVDGSRFFVGSYNFDPRSELLNCEMGVLIESPELAAQLDAFFVERIPDAAYRVTLDETGALQWRGGADGVLRREPGTTAVSRALLAVLGWLPIEWLL